MTIKEAAEYVGITSDNIRFYEKEGLIKPERTLKNNYRNYSEEDVETLRKIKILRMIGITVADIKKLLENQEAFIEVIEKRRCEIKETTKDLREMDQVCQFILKEEMKFEELDSEVLDMLDKKVVPFKERLEKIIQEDSAQEILTDRKMNNIIGMRVVYAYLLAAGLIFLFATYMFGKEWFNVLGAICFSGGSYMCSFGVVWNTKKVTQEVIFQIVALMLVPFMICLIYGAMYDLYLGAGLVERTAEGEYTRESLLLFRNAASLYCVLIAGGAGFLWMAASKKIALFQKYWKAALVMLCYTAVAAVVFTKVIGTVYIGSFVLILIVMTYITGLWVGANRAKREKNRYYAVKVSTEMLNVIVKLFNKNV